MSSFAAWKKIFLRHPTPLNPRQVIHQGLGHMMPFSVEIASICLGHPTFVEFSFIQLYDYLVIRTLKFKHILLKSTSYKKLKAFQFFYEGSIKKLKLPRMRSWLFLCACKGFNERTLYKAIVQVSNSSGDVCSAACTCPAGIGLGGLVIVITLVGFYLLLKILTARAYNSIQILSLALRNCLPGMFQVLQHKILTQSL